MKTTGLKGTLGLTGQVGVIVLAVLGAGCKKRPPPGPATTSIASATMPAEEAEPPPEERPRLRPSLKASRPLLDPVLKFVPADGLRGPASVLHDDLGDAYLVSNVDGPPTARDGNGFISKLSPDGKKLFLRWIEGGKKRVVLNAPKGMALRGGELFVADIDTVRVFDRRTGAPRGEIKVEGATYLDDITLAPDGRVFVSDAGMKPNAAGDGFEPSGTDAVYSIYRDEHVTNVMLVAKRSLAGPTALLGTPDKTWGVMFRTGELFAITKDGALEDIHVLPDSELTGIAGAGRELLVASRSASAIFRGTPGGDWRIAVGDVKSPGDIDYDRKRKRLLVPLSTENEVRVYDLR